MERVHRLCDYMKVEKGTAWKNLEFGLISVELDWSHEMKYRSGNLIPYFRRLKADSGIFPMASMLPSVVLEVRNSESLAQECFRLSF